MRSRAGLTWWAASLAFLAGLAVLFLAAPPAARAQTAPAGAKPSAAAAAAEESEEVTVTGTRIGRDNLEEYAPIAVVNSSQIEASGVSSVHELLTQLPAVTLQGISRNDNNGGQGLAFVDLRNLGVDRTLVLVNGKRFVTSNSDVSEAVDLNNIPVAMIDRIEVSLDSGSAVYGSDAVGGVINIILKDNFDGFQFDAMGGVTDKGDGDTIQLSGIWGANTDRGNITIATSWVQNGEVKQKDRNWSRYPVVASFFNEDGSITKVFGSGFAPEGVADPGYVFRPDPATGASFQPFDTLETTAQGGSRFNYGDYQWLTGQSTRYSIDGMGHLDLNDHVTAYMDGMFTYRQSAQSLAPEPIGGGTNTHPNGWVIPVTNPLIPKDALDAILAEDPEAESIFFSKRMADFGGRTYRNDTDTFRIVTGLKGDIAQGWNYDTFLNYGRNTHTQRSENLTNLTRLLEASDPVLCAQNADKGCVLADVFGANKMSQQAIDYIRYTGVQTKQHEQFDLGASVTGPVAKLPAGDLKIAFGGEWRDEEGFNQPDPVQILGDSANDAQQPTRGGYTLGEVFAESSIPVLKDQGLKELTLDVAGRYTNYDTFGDDFVYRGGVSLAPTSDVRFRGIYGTAFRAPSINDLYGGAVRSFQTAQDPCNDWDTDPNIDPVVRANCEAAGVPAGYSQIATGNDQVPTDIGGNPNLDAEKSDTYSVGAVITPSFIENFSFTADYYYIEVKDSITNPDEQTILDNCYSTPGLSSPDCARVRRDPTGRIIQVAAIEDNIGKERTDGIDFTTNYSFDLDKVGAADVGTIDLGFSGNYLLHYTQFDGEGVKDELRGTEAGLTGNYAVWKWYQTTGFRRGGFSFTNTVRFIGDAKSQEVGPEDPYRRVHAVSYWDVEGSYSWDNYTVSLGINNLLDKDPPFLQEGGQNANAEGYDFLGRFLFGRVSYKM
ncbi:MAG: TonB-dependent receptor [bacterium]